MPVALRSKAWVCVLSVAGVTGSKPAGGMDVCFFMNVVCCHVQVSATGRSLVQRSLPSVIEVPKVDKVLYS